MIAYGERRGRGGSRRLVRWGRGLAALAVVAAVLGGAGPLGGTASAQATTLYVAQGGNDNGSNNCQNPSAPCKTITYALTRAVSGSTIKVSGTVHDGNITVPDTLSSITIAGAGAASPAVIDAGGIPGSAFTIDAGATARLDHLTIKNGSADDRGGGINNNGTLTVSNSTFIDNHATVWGGGIYNGEAGTLTVTGSTFTGNVSAYGGGITNMGTATVTGSAFSGNQGYGGGLENEEGGDLAISYSTISGNHSPLSGGGIYALKGTITVKCSIIKNNTASTGGGMDLEENGAVVRVSSSTFSKNTADQGGGSSGDAEDSYLTITNSTYSGNSAKHGGGFWGYNHLTVRTSTFSGNEATENGGGIFNDGGNAVITASTISRNTAPPGRGPGLLTLFYSGFGGSAKVGATIIAGNRDTDGTLDNCGGSEPAPESAGYNLTDDADGTACGFTEPTDVVGKDPRLGPLADNGGPRKPCRTKTMLPGKKSPAIGRIPNPKKLNGVVVCGPGARDQRKFSRPLSPFTDCTIGAVEVRQPEAPAITSGHSADFTTCHHRTFTVTTSGYPAPKLTVTGRLPKGLTFHDNGDGTGTFSGLPASGGVFHVTITARNGVKPEAVQEFTLAVTPCAPTCPGKPSPPGKPAPPGRPTPPGRPRPCRPSPPVVPVTG